MLRMNWAILRTMTPQQMTAWLDQEFAKKVESIPLANIQVTWNFSLLYKHLIPQQTCLIVETTTKVIANWFYSHEELFNEALDTQFNTEVEGKEKNWALCSMLVSFNNCEKQFSMQLGTVFPFACQLLAVLNRDNPQFYPLLAPYLINKEQITSLEFKVVLREQ